MGLLFWGSGTPTFWLGLLLFTKRESRTPTFKILVRTLLTLLFLGRLRPPKGLTGNKQSSRKRRIRLIFTPIFAFVRVKFPSEDSHLRAIATGRPN